MSGLPNHKAVHCPTRFQDSRRLARGLRGERSRSHHDVQLFVQRLACRDRVEVRFSLSFTLDISLQTTPTFRATLVSDVSCRDSVSFLLTILPRCLPAASKDRGVLLYTLMPAGSVIGCSVVAGLISQNLVMLLPLPLPDSFWLFYVRVPAVLAMLVCYILCLMILSATPFLWISAQSSWHGPRVCAFEALTIPSLKIQSLVARTETRANSNSSRSECD